MRRTKGQRSSLTGSSLEYIKMQQPHLHADSDLRIVHGTDIVAMAPVLIKDISKQTAVKHLQSVILDEIQHSNFIHGVLDSKGFFGFEKMHIPSMGNFG
jgi:hypothetical protein